MEIRLLPFKIWVQMAIWAALLHSVGAVAIDYFMWKVGFVYEVMAGQILLLAGGVWFLIVLVLTLLRMQKFGYLDPLRIILWVISVSLISAPLKALGEKIIEPTLRAEYDAYPQKREAALRAYFRSQSESGRIDVPLERQEEVIQKQIELYREYRARQSHLMYVVLDRVKVLGVLGIIYALILGLLLRGGGTGARPEPTLRGESADNAASS